jgi:hypothetical protein
MAILELIQNSSVPMLIKESETLFTLVLCLHALGLGFIVGISAIAALRVIGLASTVPMAPIVGFFPIMWLGFWVNAVSGVVLLTLYPLNYLTDAAFYVKMIGVVSAVVSTIKLRGVLARGDAGPGGKTVAVTVLASWFVAIPCARVVAYNATVGYQSLTAVAIAGAILFGLAYAGRRLLGFDVADASMPVRSASHTH